MIENNTVEKKDMRMANIGLAIALAVIALTVSILPFFYLKGAIVTG